MKPKPFHLRLAAFISIAATLSLLAPAHADTETWSGNTSGTWDTVSDNWLTDGTNNQFESGDSALFTGSPTINVTTATGLAIGAITLDNTFTGSVTMSGSNTVSGATTIGGGTLNLTAAAGLGTSAITVSSGGELSLNAGNNVTYSNAISGTGTITVTPGANDAFITSNLSGFMGTLNLNASGGANSGKTRFTTTQANVISSSATINVLANTTLYLNQGLNYGASVHLFGAGNNENLGALRLESNADQTGSVTLHENSFIGTNGSAATISGVIGETGGSFGFTKQGNNTLTLAGSNNYTGATTISSGTLQIGNGGTTGTLGGGAVTNNATLTFNRSNALTVGNNIGGTGTLVKIGVGTLELSGTNTHSGGTRANAGTLVLSGTRADQAGTGDWLSINNIGAQNATLKILSGANWGVRDYNIGEVTNARAAVLQTGGTLAAENGVWIGNGGSSYGYYNLSSGTLNNTGGDFAVGRGNSSTGVMDVSGGSVTTGSWIVLGRNGGTASGLLNVTGGSVTSNSNNIALNWGGSPGAISVLNVGGGAGAASVTGVSNASNYLDVSVANVTGQTGVVNLRANGTLTVAKVQAGGAASTALFNFNGGTLKATTANAGANFMNSGNMDAVTVYSGGGTIDNNSTNITIGNALAAATGNGVTSVMVTDGGSGYIGAPLVKFTDGTGNPATAYAVMADDGTGNGTFKVSSIVITSPGTYTVDPTAVTLSGGGASTAATIGTITTTVNTSGGMTFTGSGTTTLTNTNTYTGVTTIASGGTLALTGTGSIANSSNIIVNGNLNVSGLTDSTFTIGSGQKLSGDGTVNATGKTLSIAGTHAVGSSPGQQDVTGNLNYAFGSIFEWDLNATTSDPGALANNQGAYDQVAVTNNLTGSGAVFRIILGSNSFNDAFWDTGKTWNNIFTAANSFDLATIFTSFSGTGVNSLGVVDGRGSFSFAGGNTLSWSAVPELSSALAGLLVGAGLLRRRRI